MIRFPTRAIVVSGMAIALLFLAACDSGPKSKVRTYIRIHNRHDIGKVMPLFSANARITLTGGKLLVGKEHFHDVLGWEDWDTVVNSQLEASEIVMSGDTVICRLTERTNWTNIAGLPPIQYRPVRFVFQDGLIEEIRLVPTTDSIREILGVIQSISHRVAPPDSLEIRSWLDQEMFFYNAKNAKKWMTVFWGWIDSFNQEK
jgi:hypothetical protein